ncbi:MAG: hypothetical protein NPIRA04_02800 [Nitrospirales bacterium]|nr:MAG: hypothetical protein NPIRA04_02800 [Nitrospirales bacterium]
MWCLRRWVLPVVLTSTGLIIVYIAWGSVYTPETLWAPGHLSRYHADIATCGTCHEPFIGATDTQCLVCHTLQQFQLKSQPEVHRIHQEVIVRKQSCLTCHTEHRGVLASITMGTARNPHGEFIFRATSTSSCSDCHTMDTEKEKTKPVLLNNATVRHLIEEGEGAHRPGHFAHCLHCHVGGKRDVEDEDED